MVDRLTALGHLGVEIYFPRRPLPNAAPSRLAMRSAVVGPGPAIIKTIKIEAALSSAKERKLSPGVVPQLESMREKPAPKSSLVPRQRPSPQAAVYFNLLLAVSNTGVIFVSDIKTRDLPPAREASVLQFLHQVLFALGRGTAQSDLELSYFPWPATATRGAQAGVLAAKDVLAGLIGRELRESKARYLVLMGDLADKYIMDVVPDEIEVLRTPALGKLFARPTLKRELWRILQPALRTEYTDN